MSEVVRLIFGDERLALDACSGQRTIAQATDVFSYIDSNFKNWGTDVRGEATPKTPVAVHELIEDANFAKMFGALADDPGKLVLTQDQIIQFVERHRNWLRQGGLPTFFLFRSDSEFFVASVLCCSGGRLEVYVRRFGCVRAWRAGLRLRLVVPQL